MLFVRDRMSHVVYKNPEGVKRMEKDRQGNEKQKESWYNYIN